MRALMVTVLAAGLICWMSACQNQRTEPDGANPDIGGNGNGDGQDDGNDDDGMGSVEQEQGVAELKKFSSREELEEYFLEQIDRRGDVLGFTGDDSGREEDGAVSEGPVDSDSVNGGAEPPQADAGAGGDESAAEGEGEGDHSGTTIQEEGVDESDVVKTDGDFLYIMTGQKLQIASARPANDVRLMGSVELEGYGSELYIVGDRAVTLTYGSTSYPVLIDVPVGTDPNGGDPPPVDVDGTATDSGVSSSGGGSSGSAGEAIEAGRGDSDSGGSGGVDGSEGEGSDEIAPDDPISSDEPPSDVDIMPIFYEFYRPQTVVTVIDISDRSNPQVISETRFDGDQVASRMIDGVLRLVVANYQYHYFDMLAYGRGDPISMLDDVSVDELLPDYQTTNAAGEVTEGEVLDWAEFYRPVDPDGFGITTIITLDSAAPDTFSAVGVMAEPGLIYASTNALYLTDSDYYFDFRRLETDIHKFVFTEDSVALVASGKVEGRVLNQYSMGEFNGNLRVATTTDGLFLWETGEQIEGSNSVFVLGERAGELAVIGSLENLAPGETIQSARFIGEVGYLVTFLQIDPLFTLDLSDPANPRVVGELKVPGFSTHITQMDEDHILTVGVYVDPENQFQQGVQLSIFDVSDFANPVQSFNEVIGGNGTYSEATWNPKAFTWFPEQGLLALPISNRNFEVFPVEPDGGIGTGGSDAVDEPAAMPRQAPDDLGDFDGLFVYRVSAETGFEFLGASDTRPEGEDAFFFYPSFTRGVFIDANVYAVTDRSIVASPTSDVITPLSKIEIPYDFDEFPEGDDGVAEPEPGIDTDVDDNGETDGSDAEG